MLGMVDVIEWGAEACLGLSREYDLVPGASLRASKSLDAMGFMTGEDSIREERLSIIWIGYSPEVLPLTRGLIT
jgi:hypothetical protein